jgi:hypothetical protein
MDFSFLQFSWFSPMTDCSACKTAFNFFQPLAVVFLAKENKFIK